MSTKAERTRKYVSIANEDAAGGLFSTNPGLMRKPWSEGWTARKLLRYYNCVRALTKLLEIQTKLLLIYCLFAAALLHSEEVADEFTDDADYLSEQSAPEQGSIEPGSTAKDSQTQTLSKLAPAAKYTTGAEPGRMSLMLGGDYLIRDASVLYPSLQLDCAATVNLSLGLAITGIALTQGTKRHHGVDLLGALSYYPRGVYGQGFIQLAGGTRMLPKAAKIGSTLVLHGLLGWRWHAEEASQSFGIGIGPQIERVANQTTFSALLKINIGIDFLLSDIFF